MRTRSKTRGEQVAAPTTIEVPAAPSEQRGDLTARADRPDGFDGAARPVIAAAVPPVVPAPLTGVSPPPPSQPEVFARGGRTWTDPFAGFERKTLASQIWVAAKNREAQDYFNALPLFARIKEELAQPAPMPPGAPPPAPPTPVSPVLDLNDPATWSIDGSTNAVKSGTSPDGAWSAMLVGRNGGDETTLVLSPVGGPPTEYLDGVRGMPTWLPDGSGFYYVSESWRATANDQDQPGTRDIRFHRMGTPPEQDRVIFPATNDATRTPSVWKVGPYLALRVSHGWGDDDLYLRDLTAADGPARFRPLAARPNTDTNSLAWEMDRLVMKTSEGADRYRLVEVDPQQPDPAHWKTILAERPDAVLMNWVFVGDRVVALYERDGGQFMEVSRLDGQPLPNGQRSMAVQGLPDIALLKVAAEQGDDGKVRFSASSFTRPWQKFTLDPLGDPPIAQLDGPSTEDPRMKDLVTKRVFVTSKDGTRVPMFIVHHKDVPLDGNNPTILNGYGGFLQTIQPYARTRLLPFFRRGGVFAISAIRGGAEYGESWHEGGSRGNKQRSIDDFIASAEALISMGYTRPEKLGINGTSNGGLLMAAATTQRPELFRAAVMGVPLTDMLRYDTGNIGKTWVPEYGDPDQAAEMDWLWGYSPYQHVDPTKRYPAVMIGSGGGDDRVSPWHSQKMSARLHGLTRGPNLLRTGEHAGHGYNDDAAELAFLCDQLGVPLEPKYP